jgi:putative FmdB family regulatory protein
MPTYTYRCTKCGTESEVVQSMSDPPLKRCRKCRGALRRTFHPVGIVLKGSGFHRNDYRSKPAPSSSSSVEKTESSSSSDGKSSSSSSDKKSETKKPAASTGD